MRRKRGTVLLFRDEIDRSDSVFRNATPRAVMQVPAVSSRGTSHACALWLVRQLRVIHRFQIDRKSRLKKLRRLFLKIFDLKSVKKIFGLKNLWPCVPQAKKFCGGKTLEPPKNVNLILRAKTLNSPNGGGPHITPRLLERKCGILYPG